jgi:5-methylcytosine-specific restriction endonuclease McrA
MCEEKTKACSKCGIEKPLTEYYKKKSGKNGLRADCKKCFKAYKKKYYQENAEEIKTRNKKWKKENPEEIKTTNKKYRETNREKEKARHKKWRKENPEYNKKWRKENPEYNKKWLNDNREKARLYCHRRRALLFKATTEDFSYEDLLDFWNENEINYKECFYCKKEMPEGPEHVDHYYPLSKGGPHERANLRPSCAQCNLSKHAKQPETFMEELNNGL